MKRFISERGQKSGRIRGKPGDPVVSSFRSRRVWRTVLSICATPRCRAGRRALWFDESILMQRRIDQRVQAASQSLY